MPEYSSHPICTLGRNRDLHGAKHSLNSGFFNDQHQRRLRISQYVFKDFLRKPKPVEAKLLVLSEPIKPNSRHVKGSVLLIVLVLAFIFGFTLGSVFPVYLSPNRTPFLAISKDSSSVKNITLNSNLSLSDIYVTDENNIIVSKLFEGIYWSDLVEKSLPVGFSNEHDRRWEETVRNAKIVRIEEGCGRMQNRLVTFEDGTKACCRYRQNTDQIQGEIFSYYLGRLLGLKNLVPSTLSTINSSNPLWMSVKSNLESSQWSEGRSVVLTEFLDDLEPALIPPTLKNHTGDVLNVQGKKLASQTHMSTTLRNMPEEGKIMDIVGGMKTKEDTIEMAQWSDLIVFDYLTANLDRVVNNLYNLQWNSGMLSSPAHNLARASSSKILVFLDNESGLLHGYRLLQKYEPYHSLLLDSLCVFRKPTVEALKAFKALKGQSHFSTLLAQGLPSPDVLPPLPEKNINILSQRVERVLRQVEACANKSSALL